MGSVIVVLSVILVTSAKVKEKQSPQEVQRLRRASKTWP